MRGLLVYRAWLVGSHKPWASKEEEDIPLRFFSSLLRACALSAAMWELGRQKGGEPPRLWKRILRLL